jgi:PQQ-dependent catabolism-associated beta-propeller protein
MTPRPTAGFAANFGLGRVLRLAAALAPLLLGAAPAQAFRIFVSNEKDNTVTVLDGATLAIKATVPVGARPRGMVLSKDGRSLYICTSDADHIEVLDVATLTVTRTLPSGADPEFMALSPDGTKLYVANEDNSEVSVLDVQKGEVTAEIPVGVEPEGMAVSPDGKTVVCTSETTSMAHFIDVATHQVTASVLVGTRPRYAVFTRDGSKVWVSSEVAGTVAIIDAASHKVLDTIHFNLPEVPKDSVQAVGINLTEDGKLAFVDLGPANRVAVVDQSTGAVRKYLLVGQRVWHGAFSPDQKFLYTANGISNDMSVIDVKRLDVTQSVPVGQSPWGIVVAQ